MTAGVPSFQTSNGYIFSTLIIATVVLSCHCITPSEKENHSDIFLPADHALSSSTSLHSQTFPVFLVVSHCKQDLSWLFNITSSFIISDIMIYSKCNFPVVGAPPNSRVEVLPNVGRCDHSYIHYLTQMNSTKGVVLFLKDTTHVHNVRANDKGMIIVRSYKDMIFAAAASSKFSCRQYIDEEIGLSNQAISKYLVKFKIPMYNMSIHNYTNDQFASFSLNRSMKEWIKELGVPLRFPVTPVCYGGVFAVNVERLRAISPGVWTGLRDSLARGDNIEEGHFMERSWAGMLSLEPLTIAIEDYDQFKGTVCLRRNVCGYRGHVVLNREAVKKNRLCAERQSRTVQSIRPCFIRKVSRQPVRSESA